MAKLQINFKFLFIFQILMITAYIRLGLRIKIKTVKLFDQTKDYI